MSTYTIQGTSAIHTVTVRGPITDEEYAAQQAAGIKSDIWSPENGSSFKNITQAKRWLTTMLVKPGWPEPTTWEIVEGPWHPYCRLIEPGQSGAIPEAPQTLPEPRQMLLEQDECGHIVQINWNDTPRNANQVSIMNRSDAFVLARQLNSLLGLEGG